MIEDSKGNVWLGTGEVKYGLIRFDYSSVHKNKEPLVPVLHSVKINNEKICWQDLLPRSGKSGPGPHITEEATTFGFILTDEARDSMRSRFKGIKFDSVRRFYPIPENLVLPYRHNNISVDFGSVELNRPNLVRYQYILEGHDKEWSPVGNMASAIFGNLPEGTYVFKLRAQTPFGIWSDPIEYTFKVLPPWYRTWWAYGLYILVFSISVWGFVKWRIHAVKKENKALEEKVINRTHELEQSLEEKYALSKKVESQEALLNERLRISRELHDDIGSTLSGIVLYSHLAEDQVKARRAEEAKDSLDRIQHSANDMVSRLYDLVWAVNPDHNSLQELMQKLEEYAREMSGAKNIKVQMNVQDGLAEFQLPLENRHHIYLLGKEAINNAVKYSGATTLELCVHRLNGFIEFIIRDNGKGFDLATVEKGNGLTNMQQRADEAGSTLSVRSSPQQGTAITWQCSIGMP